MTCSVPEHSRRWSGHAPTGRSGSRRCRQGRSRRQWTDRCTGRSGHRGNVDQKVLFHLVLVDHLSDLQGDVGSSRQSDAGSDGVEFRLGRFQQGLAPVPTPFGQLRVAAGNQPFTGKIGVGEFEQVASIQRIQQVNTRISLRIDVLFSALIQSIPWNVRSWSMVVCTTMPRSPATTIQLRPNRSRTRSISGSRVSGSAVLLL